MSSQASHHPTEHRRVPWAAGLCLLAAIATFLLWDKHESHILRALPYVFLLACPLLHLLMHRSHGAGHGHRSQAHEGQQP